MGESRTELLAWLNDLCQLNYTKVEQCGSGAAYCNIMDSIFRDVPLSKVKFTAKHEYEYVANYKILQASFDRHKIDNAIPVDRLLKCKFQDNLEFLQWMKKYWDQYWPGGTYDAVARRGSAVGGAAKAPSPSTKPASAAPTRSTIPSAGSAAARKPSASTSRVAASTVSPSSPSSSMAGSSRLAGSSSLSSSRSTLAGSAPASASMSAAAAAAAAAAAKEWEREKAEMEAEYQRMLAEMTQQTMELKLSIEQVEKEREFYFGKLREIEIYVQGQVDAVAVAGEDGIVDGLLSTEETLRQIQAIMYKTEDGFEIPADGIDEEEESY